jgi:diaminopimelate decarboxylase
MRAFEAIATRQALIPIGLHLHIGTGLKSVSMYEQAIRESIEFAREVNQRFGINLTLFDLGGGFGVPTVRSRDPWDERMLSLGYPSREALLEDCPTPHEYASHIAELFSNPMAQTEHEIILEAGRAVTSSAQTLVLSVIAVKETAGRRRLILDGGKNITLPLGWETHKIFPVCGLNDTFNVRTDLYGPLCHPGDIVAEHLNLPRLETGDAVCIMDAGAYFVPNQMNFSNPRPPIVTVEAGSVNLVRQRESFDDIVRLDDLGTSA